MELRQLKYFLEVADARSFVSAANALFVSRQAVSKAVGQLEAELGVELFVRDPSGAFLTPTGLQFYERVRSILMELDNLSDQIRTTSNRYRQRIRIAFSIGTVSLMEESLLAFRETKENLEIEYWEYPQEECFRLLQEHQVDIMISGQKNPTPQFLSEEILSSPMGVLLREGDGLENVDALDIADLTWIPLAASMDQQIQEFCSKYRLSITYRGHDFHRLFGFVLSGKSALILPKCLIPEEIPLLKWIPLQYPESWKLYCTYPQSAETDLLYSLVLEELRQQVLRLKK